MADNFEMANSTNMPGEEVPLQSPAELDRAMDEAAEAESKAQQAAEEKPSNVSESTEQIPSEESVEDLKAQRDRLYARLKKEEQKNKVVKPAAHTGGEDEWKSKVEFLLENRDVTEDEYEHLANVAYRRSGSVNAESLRDAKKAEIEYITFKRKKEELKRKVPGSTPSSPFGKLVKSNEEIGKMTPEQHRKYEMEILKAEENQGI